MYYALTIRKCTLTSTPKQAAQVFKDLNYFIKRLKQFRPDVQVEYHFEAKEHDGPKWNIHLHAMLKSQLRVTIGDIRICKGYHRNLTTVRSVIAWNVYISKGHDDQEKILSRVSRASAKGPSGYGACKTQSIRSSDLYGERIAHESYMKRICRINLFKMA